MSKDDAATDLTQDLPRTSNARTARWRKVWLTWGALGLVVLSLELAGYRHEGVTMQVLLAVGTIAGLALAAAWAVGKAPQVLLLYITCCLMIILAEIVLRVTDSSITNPWTSVFCFDARLGWHLVPGAEVEWHTGRERTTHVRINSDGFHDRDYERAIGPNTTPVMAVLGDSMVANINVEQPEVFTALVQQQTPLWSVRNFGVGGYGQVQELLLLKDVLRTWSPKIAVIVVYPGNDFTDNLGDYGVTGYHRPGCRLSSDGDLELLGDVTASDRRLPPPTIHSFISGTRLYGLAKSAAERTLFSKKEMPFEFRLCRREWGTEETYAWEIMKALLAAMARECQQHDCVFAVVVAPCHWQVQQEDWQQVAVEYRLDRSVYSRAGPNERIVAVCAERGYPCLDLLPVLKRFADQGERLYYRTDIHWNAQGQIRVAEAIAQWMRQEERLRRP
jgi:hypothetical protein